uniref:Uncharacterized protein n=1 Tax=Bombyx mori TaxID=7091 RepID=A0A8R2DK99_BOMMO|nr:uncharacterized protein LOC110385142 [Bombyx mori]
MPDDRFSRKGKKVLHRNRPPVFSVLQDKKMSNKIFDPVIFGYALSNIWHWPSTELRHCQRQQSYPTFKLTSRTMIPVRAHTKPCLRLAYKLDPTKSFVMV